ncbi:hypothetical protein V8G54_007013 [Vigna mungo]|uniref:Uncharacterized protein n=1 Tax=Vigna mungo TaxID=3915 RepID=A0AAQ3P054_VIGMU
MEVVIRRYICGVDLLRQAALQARGKHSACVDASSLGLEEIERRIKNGEFNWRANREDVLMNIGEPAKKLHTARSRNDQVFTDFRLWCRDAIDEILVVRGDFIIFFNQIFDALCKLSADSNANVQSVAHLLDRLVKDIVTESDQFSIEEFIPLPRERMSVLNPYVRQFLVGWITVLDSVPDIDILGFLPDFLDVLLLKSVDYGRPSYPDTMVRSQFHTYWHPYQGTRLTFITASEEELRSHLAKLVKNVEEMVSGCRTSDADGPPRLTNLRLCQCSYREASDVKSSPATPSATGVTVSYVVRFSPFLLLFAREVVRLLPVPRLRHHDEVGRRHDCIRVVALPHRLREPPRTTVITAD